MHFKIRQLYQQGKKRSQYDLDRDPRILGDVQIHLEQKSPMGWPSLCAYLFKSSPRQPDALPRLYDVRLEGMATLGMVIVGVEVIDGQQYQQAWHCAPPDGAVVIPWSRGPRSTLNELI